MNELIILASHYIINSVVVVVVQEEDVYLCRKPAARKQRETIFAGLLEKEYSSYHVLAISISLFEMH